MQSVQDYLDKDLLNFSAPVAVGFDDPREKLESRIFRILTSSVFRSGPLTDEIAKMIRTKIVLSITENKPITLIVGMGGGRGINTIGHPGINWAEVFHLKFLYDQLGKTAKIFKPGVLIEFCTDDYAVELINNYKKEDIDTYHREFGSVISYFNKNLPTNFQFVLKRSSDSYPDKEKLKKQVFEEKEKLLLDIEQCETIKKDWFDRAMNNIDFPLNLSQEEKEKLAYDRMILNMAWLNTDFANRGEYFEGGVNISLIHFNAFPGFQTKTVGSSNIQFWKGNGILVRKNDSYYPDVISRKKYAELLDRLSLAEVSIPTEIGFKGLSSISVL